MKIVILGSGNMATAFSSIAPKDSKVVLYTIEKDVLEDVNKNHYNSKYASIRLESNVSASMNLKDSLEAADIVVFSVPSGAVKKVCSEAKGMIPKKAIIISFTKGLDESSNKTISEVIGEYFGNEVVVVGGPSIANELMNKSQTFVVFASKGSAAEKCRKIFQNDYYNISTTSDVLGVELCSFLKNVYAIYLGIASGMNYGMNTKAALISKCLEEMSVLCKKLGARKESVYSLAGVGDLIVTSLSNEGRNKRFGELIARGESAMQAKKTVGQVVEGETALRVLKNISEKKNLKLPIFEKIYGIVFLNTKPSI